MGHETLPGRGQAHRPRQPLRGSLYSNGKPSVSYRAGIGPGLRQLGLEPGPPMIKCDALYCKAVIVLDGDPPEWFLNRKAKPGWGLTRVEHADGSVTRADLCPLHRPTKRAARSTAGRVGGK